MKLFLIASSMGFAAAATSHLTKRCTPNSNPDFFQGYNPPAPCWQSFNPACQPYLRQSTEMTIDREHNLVVIYGVDEYCFDIIAEELAREEDGRRTYGWTEKHGHLTPIEAEGILVISNMADETVERYAKLTYDSGLQGIVDT